MRLLQRLPRLFTTLCFPLLSLSPLANNCVCLEPTPQLRLGALPPQRFTMPPSNHHYYLRGNCVHRKYQLKTAQPSQKADASTAAKTANATNDVLTTIIKKNTIIFHVLLVITPFAFAAIIFVPTEASFMTIPQEPDHICNSVPKKM